MATAPDLSVEYLGFQLAHPFIIGASPLVDNLDTVRRLEDGGCAAIVMHSLFEEQITASRTGRVHHLDPLDARFATVLSYFPDPERYAFAPDQYLEQVRRIKLAVKVPVVASLNGASAESWLTFAQQLPAAGADALELNIYDVVADAEQSGPMIERELIQAVHELKRNLAIPIAVKLSPFFTAFGHLARELDRVGADALVLFNRFYQPDLDIDELSVVPQARLSTNAELPLRLRWLAILHGRLSAALAVTGGIGEPADGVKAILTGAHAVQMVSAILRHGPSHFGIMRDGLRQWMESRGFTTLHDVRGRLSLAHSPNTGAFERAGYLQTLLGGWADGAPSTPTTDDGIRKPAR